jgi:hypothetical protein
MQQAYRANITAAEFPFLSELHGRTVIIPGLDQNFSRQANSTRNKDRDIGIPQVYYMHNVMPTEAGVTSVGYSDIVLSPEDTDDTFSQIFSIREYNTDNVGYLATTLSGRNYVMKGIGANWVRTTDKYALPGTLITTATVNGQTYIYYAGVGCCKYNYTTNVLEQVTLLGLNSAQVLGICAANGYMIAWTADAVAWSSTISPTDFIPSLVTGAGGGAVQEAKAEITACLPYDDGFVIYTKKNAISAIYSGNAQYPFNTKEIHGAGGLIDVSLVAYDGNSTDQVAFTTAGLQQISNINAAIIHPQLTDFIAGSKFEDFDEITKQFSTTVLGQFPMRKKLSIVANRYLILSYGVSELTHALVYDVAHGRWGKLKVTHVDCFEYQYPINAVIETPRRSIAFLQQDGTIKSCILAYDTTGSYGTVIMGKYQLERNRALDLQEIHLDTIKSDTALQITVKTSYDGYSETLQTPVLAKNLNGSQRYNCRASGVEHSIIITGGFHLNSVVLRFTDEGEVR